MNHQLLGYRYAISRNPASARLSLYCLFWILQTGVWLSQSFRCFLYHTIMEQISTILKLCLLIFILKSCQILEDKVFKHVHLVFNQTIPQTPILVHSYIIWKDQIYLIHKAHFKLFKIISHFISGILSYSALSSGENNASNTSGQAKQER